MLPAHWVNIEYQISSIEYWISNVYFKRRWNHVMESGSWAFTHPWFLSSICKSDLESDQNKPMPINISWLVRIHLIWTGQMRPSLIWYERFRCARHSSDMNGSYAAAMAQRKICDTSWNKPDSLIKVCLSICSMRWITRHVIRRPVHMFNSNGHLDR